MLAVAAIEKGIVIDHIQAGLGIKLFHYLGLDQAQFPVALISNVRSTKHGRKDIIKIQNLIELDFHKIGLIDPHLTINIIENEETTKKLKLTLPKQVEGVLICNNPRCVTSIEQQIPHIFTLVEEKSASYQCQYCEDIQARMNFKI